jgi:hypothetical protein
VLRWLLLLTHAEKSPHDLAAECLQVPQIPQQHPCPGVLQPLDTLGFRAFGGAQEQFETAESDQDLQTVWVCHRDASTNVLITAKYAAFMPSQWWSKALAAAS